MSDLDDIFASFKKKKAEAITTTTPPAVKTTRKKKRKTAASDDDAAEVTPTPKKKVKKSKLRSDANNSKAKISDSDFFNLRGEGTGENDDGEEDAQPINPATLAALAELQQGAPKTKIVIGNLHPGVKEIYTEVLNGLLEGIEQPSSFEVDWGTHVVRMKFAKAEDALVAANVLENKELYHRPLKTGMTLKREGEVLVRNLLSHVTEDVLQHYMQKFGQVISCKVLSHHAVWSKAYVLFADERDAIASVKALHGVQNTIQDAAIFLSTTSVHELPKRKKAKAKKPTDAEGNKVDDSGSDEPYEYNVTMEAGY